MKISKIFITVLAAVLVSSCASEPKPTVSPQEIKGLQSHEYEAQKDIVFPSVISALEDLGYTISSSDMNAGLIDAEGPSKDDPKAKLLFGVIKITQPKATAVLEQLGDTTRVSLDFVMHVSNSTLDLKQTENKETPILDAQLYEEAFEKVESEIFMRISN